MGNIEKATKLAVDQQLDAGLPSPPTGEQEKYLIDLLRYVESYWKFAIPHEVAKRGHSSESVLKSRALNAAGLCLSICCKQSVDSGESTWHAGETGEDDIRAWKTIFDDALKYSDMCDWMMVFWNDACKIDQVSPTEFVFSYSAERERLEVAEWLLKKLDTPIILAANVDLSFLVGEISKAGLDAMLALRIPLSILQRVQEWVAAEQTTCWNLGGTIALDGFTLGEYRKFWTALSTVVAIHKFAWNTAGADEQLSISVPVMEGDALADLLSKLSELSVERVRFLIQYITCDIRRWRSGKSQDAMLQPIFVLSENKLAISPSLILESNAERNVLDLVNRKNSSVYDRVKDLKEEQWSAELEQVLRGYRLTAKAQVKYANTKMDLIIINEKRSFALTCELKWILTADRIKADHVEYVSEGFGQAWRASEWSAGNRDALAERLDLPKGSLQNCDFKPLLICKDTLLNGLAKHEDVPIACGRLFDWLVKQTRGNVEKTWSVIHSGTFLPIRDKHFQARKSTLEFNGITFHVVGFDAVPGNEWMPERDINLTGAV